MSTISPHSVCASPWLVSQKYCPEAKHRLICIPHAGSGIMPYVSWGKALEPDIEVLVVRLPGRETRWKEPACTDIDRVVESLVEAILDLPPVPFSLLGHSLGATLGFEVARKLEALGVRPARVIVSAALPPHKRPPCLGLGGLPDPLLIQRVEGLYGPFPEAIRSDAEMMHLILKTLRADFGLLESYVYREGPPLTVPIVVLSGASDPTTPEATLRSWQEQSSQTSFHRFPGGHFYLLEASAAAVLNILRLV